MSLLILFTILSLCVHSHAHAHSHTHTLAPTFGLKDGAQPDWFDYFKGTSLDNQKWPQVQNYIYPNGRVQFSPKNVVVNDGLTLYAFNNGGPDSCGWTGASIDGWTYPGTDRNEFLYGVTLFKGVQFKGVSGMNPIILFWDQTNNWEAELDLLETADGVIWNVNFHSGGNTGDDQQVNLLGDGDISVPFELGFIRTSKGYYVYRNKALVASYEGEQNVEIYQKPMFISLWMGVNTYGGLPPPQASGGWFKVGGVEHYPLDALAWGPTTHSNTTQVV